MSTAHIQQTIADLKGIQSQLASAVDLLEQIEAGANPLRQIPNFPANPSHEAVRRQPVPRGTAKQTRPAAQRPNYGLKSARNKAKAKSPPRLDVNAPVATSIGPPREVPTLGGLMKQFIRNQTRFTGEALRGLIEADPVGKTLLEQASTSLFGVNLKYWSDRGYLESDGKTPLEATFTVKDREWFAPKET